MLNIIVDENISFAKEAFSHLGNVSIIHGREINNGSLKNAEALIVRSITRVDEKLLKNTPVKFVGTATIGTDHIDINYLNSNGIVFSDAKGCNADAVTEYVFTAVTKILNKKHLTLKDKKIGVVGVGNIGSKVARIAEVMGMQVLKNDPPLQRKSGSNGFATLDEIYSCDIITIHVPLNKSGLDKTVHLFNQQNLNLLKQNSIFINASRGQVVDNKALGETITNNSLEVVLDVWENEPGIDTSLLEKVKIGTPHIAGYSLEGKVNGTTIIYNALCNFLGVKPIWKPALPIINKSEIYINQNRDITDELDKIVSFIYDINNDDVKLRKMITLPEAETSKYFDTLRKEYPLRREFSNFRIHTIKNDDDQIRVLKELRFKINS